MEGDWGGMRELLVVYMKAPTWYSSQMVKRKMKIINYNSQYIGKIFKQNICESDAASCEDPPVCGLRTSYF
jgi:hypothetical protein